MLSESFVSVFEVDVYSIYCSFLTNNCLLLISAPSLGVYYCQQLTLSVCPDVPLSVCLSHPFILLLLFCFSMESSHFLAVSSPCAPLYKTFLRFLI